jgi:hypothetical protein
VGDFQAARDPAAAAAAVAPTSLPIA